MKPGAEALQGLADLARTAAIIAEELRGEIFETDRAPGAGRLARY